MKQTVSIIILLKRTTFHLSERRLSVVFVLAVGKDKKEEEGRERSVRKQKNATGDGQSWEKDFRYLTNYEVTTLKMHLCFLCPLGARSLAGNCSGDPTPCCSVAQYLFPAQ